MKQFRRMLCVFLSITMLFSMFGVNVSAAAAPKLNKSMLTMIVGSSTTLKVTGASGTVTWSSSNKSVCTVSKGGKVKAVSPGTANICAKVGSKKLYCKVKVVKSYIGSTSAKTMNKGEKLTLTLKAYKVKAVTVSSSDSKIVKVSKSSVSDGKIKVTVEAVSGGTAYINVRDKNNKNAAAKVKITVNAPVNTTPDTDKSNGTSKGLAIRVVDDGYGNQKIILIEYDIDEVNPGSSADYAEEMLELVNAERKKVGAPALVLDDELCKAAQVRAKELGEKFSHTRPDGSDCFTVLKSYNISCVYAGENIAQGSSTSKGAMNQWMNSSGHRSNLLRSGWRKMGVGYDSDTNSWVQIFID